MLMSVVQPVIEEEVQSVERQANRNSEIGDTVVQQKLGCGAASLGDWCPKIPGSLMVPKRRALSTQ
jgi:hypothetical protein